MSKTTLIIKKVCDELGLDIKFLDDYDCVMKVGLNGSRYHIFIANNSGLNDEVVRKICNDKFYTYILLKDKINFPKTLSFVDPHADNIYEGYGNLNSNKEIVSKILASHKFPVLVKANSLSRGLNIFKCENDEQVAFAVESIFNNQSKNYDHVLISQDFINIAKEYRVLVYNQKIMFFYLKDNITGQVANNLITGSLIDGVEIDDATKNIHIKPEFVGNLSPLHWENSKAVLINDQDLQNELQQFIEPIFSKLNLKYGGLDVGRDKNGNLWLIEINTQPGFSHYIRDNTDEEVVKMYKKILGDLIN